MPRLVVYIMVVLAACALAAGCSGGDDPVQPDGGGGDRNGDNDGGGQYVDKKIYISSAEQLSALTALVPGDTVVLADGTYTGKTFTFIANGTQAHPVVLMAATPGRAVITGNSSLVIAGSWLVVSGLWFRDATTPGDRAVIEFRRRSPLLLAEDCRLTDCAITGDGLAESLTDYKWVSLFGRRNRVDGCTFLQKKNMGTLLVVWFTEGQVPGHTISGNRFSRPTSLLDDDGKQRNGQETIRVGDSNASMSEGGCIIEGNVFDRCDGEIEAISNKSCKNIYRGNLFRRSAATLTLRHGNDCLIENNLFLGEGVANSGGVRIIGEGHTVQGNYFEELRGSGYRTAICIVRGLPDSPLSGYYQAKNAQVTQNIVVNCTNGLNVNYGDSDMTMPVISTTVSGNVISNTSSSNTAIDLVVTTPAAGVTWTGNTVWGGKYKGGMSASIVPMASQQPSVASRQAMAASIEAASGIKWQMTN